MRAEWYTLVAERQTGVSSILAPVRPRAAGGPVSKLMADVLHADLDEIKELVVQRGDTRAPVARAERRAMVSFVLLMESKGELCKWHSGVSDTFCGAGVSKGADLSFRDERRASVTLVLLNGFAFSRAACRNCGVPILICDMSSLGTAGDGLTGLPTRMSSLHELMLPDGALSDSHICGSSVSVDVVLMPCIWRPASPPGRCRCPSAPLLATQPRNSTRASEEDKESPPVRLCSDVPGRAAVAPTGA
mmetsp:Transcript_690/g.1820  ORF Transcript_690/g.1820 Transcript_690/m.1820 type:complete len:247 (-) Transcript_690:418-1158(-)